MMKQSIYFLVIVLINTIIFFSIKTNVYSAHGMKGVAINEQTKECAGYYGGDEFVNYKLPDGWKVYYPDYSLRKEGTCIEGVGECKGKFQCISNGKTLAQCYSIKNNCTHSDACMNESVPIITEIGKCNFSQYGEAPCCSQLGYKFIANNIGKGNITNLGIQDLVLSVLNQKGFIVLLILLIIIFLTFKFLKKRKENTIN